MFSAGTYTRAYCSTIKKGFDCGPVYTALPMTVIMESTVLAGYLEAEHEDLEVWHWAGLHWRCDSKIFPRYRNNSYQLQHDGSCRSACNYSKSAIWCQIHKYEKVQARYLIMTERFTPVAYRTLNARQQLQHNCFWTKCFCSSRYFKHLAWLILVFARGDCSGCCRPTGAWLSCWHTCMSTLPAEWRNQGICVPTLMQMLFCIIFFTKSVRRQLSAMIFLSWQQHIICVMRWYQDAIIQVTSI